VFAATDVVGSTPPEVAVLAEKNFRPSQALALPVSGHVPSSPGRGRRRYRHLLPRPPQGPTGALAASGAGDRGMSRALSTSGSRRSWQASDGPTCRSHPVLGYVGLTR
jgi:hypothetical protein